MWYQTTYVDLAWRWLVRKCDLYRGKCANLNIDIKYRLWRHAVTLSVTWSTSKVFFLGQFVTIFPYLMSKSTYIKYFEIFKMAAILRSGWSFKHKDRPCHCLHFELLIDTRAQILTELWQFRNLTNFLTSWPCYFTFDLDRLETSVPTQGAYVGQFWWFVKAFMGYGDRNRQTYRQISKPWHEHTCQNVNFG